MANILYCELSFLKIVSTYFLIFLWCGTGLSTNKSQFLAIRWIIRCEVIPWLIHTLKQYVWLGSLSGLWLKNKSTKSPFTQSYFIFTLYKFMPNFFIIEKDDEIFKIYFLFTLPQFALPFIYTRLSSLRNTLKKIITNGERTMVLCNLTKMYVF